MLIRIGIAAQLLGVTPKTLRRWEALGLLRPTLRTRGGHRRYDTTTLHHPRKPDSTLNEKLQRDSRPQRVVAYARVSSTKQRKEQLMMRRWA